MSETGDFVCDNTLRVVGTCLLREIDTTYERVATLFGDMDDSQDRQWPKYGKSWRLLHRPTQTTFTVYRSYGAWRIGGPMGGEGLQAVEDLAALLESHQHFD